MERRAPQGRDQCPEPGWLVNDWVDTPVRGRGWARFRSGVLIGLGLLLIPATIYGPRLWTIWRFAGEAHVPSVDRQFGKLPKLLPARGSPLTDLHAGLAHNYQDRKQFTEEVWNSPTLSLHGYRFHAEPWEPADPLFPAIVLGVLTNPDAYRPYGGPKLCGGYHADFAAGFESAETRTWFLVCLGCSEVIIFTDHDELICELEPAAHRALVAAYGKAVRSSLPLRK